MAETAKSQLIDQTSSTSYQFITIKGEFRRLGQTVEDITRKAVDGHAIRLQGQRGDRFDLHATLDYQSGDDVQSDDNDFTAMRGSLVNIIDDFTETYHDLILINAVKEKEGPALAAIGGVSGASANSAVVLVTWRFTLLHTHLDS